MNQLLDYIHSLPDGIIYVALCLCAFAENIFPPFPGDTITAFGAFLVGIGRLNLFLVLFSVTIGSLGGFIALFLIGSALGRRFFTNRNHGIFSFDKITKAETWFRKHGYFIILINRFLPGIRSVISITAGISRLNILKTITLALVSCIFWNLIWISMGYLLGDNWETIEARLSYIFMRYNFSVLILIIAIVIFFMIQKARRSNH